MTIDDAVDRWTEACWERRYGQQEEVEVCPHCNKYPIQCICDYEPEEEDLMLAMPATWIWADPDGVRQRQEVLLNLRKIDNDRRV